jgi:hypothetical protein
MSTPVLPGDLLAKSGEAVKSGPIGLAIILILCVACYFLFKSMSRHLKAVREDFPKDEAEKSAASAASPATPTAAASVEPVVDQPAAPPAASEE